MSNKKLTILAIAAVIMVVLAAVQSRVANKPAGQSNVQARLIQGLNPDDIGTIVVEKAGKAVTLKRDGEGFVVFEKDNYPANSEAINALITMCLDMTTSELYTANKENFKDLQLTEADAQSVIKFFNKDSSPLTGVVIGKARDDKGTFVRLTSNDNVYVTFNELWLKENPIDFVVANLISAKAEDVNSVTVSGPKGKYVLNAQGGEAVLKDVPAGKKAKADECKTVLQGLSNLSFDDVKPLSAEKDMVFDRQYVCSLKDSTVYTVNIAKKGDETFVKCAATFTDNEKVTIDKNESQEQLKKKEAKLLAKDNVKKFNAKHQDWIYRIPDYSAKNLVTEDSQLVEDMPKPKDANEPNQPAEPNLTSNK